MPNITFKVSDGQKHNFLWALLNPNYNEENNWSVEYGICDIYDEYAIVRNYAEGIFERVYYTKNDETDSLEITNKERCYIVDVNETEKHALEMLHKLNNNTYEAIDEKVTGLENDLGAAKDTIAERDETINSLNEEISLNNTKIEELSGENATLNQEKNDAIALHTAATERITSMEEELSTVTAQRDELATFKKNTEDEEKQTLIESYSEQLPEDVISDYVSNMDNYSIEELDMKLTYELKKNHPEMFGKNTPPAYIPKTEGIEGGINAILAKYKK